MHKKFNSEVWNLYLQEKQNRELIKEKKQKKIEDATLVDLLNPKKYLKNKDQVDERISICEKCEFFIKITKQCSKCGCFMNLKTRLTDASCPEGKW